MPRARNTQHGGGKMDGTYDNRPIDPEYFKKYMSVRVACPLCNLSVLRGVLARHKREQSALKGR
jgi:hypothetical protein